MPLFVIIGVGSPGKTTIVSLAREAVKKSPFYLFSPLYHTVQREQKLEKEKDGEGVVTPEYQDELHVTEEEFKSLRDDAGFCHAWKERTFNYGFLKEVQEALVAEKKVVVSAPPTALPEIETAFSSFQTTVVRVTAPPEVLAARKTQNKPDIKSMVKRLAKLQNELRLRGDQVIENVGTPEEGRTALLTIMGFDAETEIPPPDANDLQNCLAQDYLKRTVFPHLASGLTLLDHVRPADPVDFLAMYLYRSATTQAHKVAEIKEQQRLRAELRSTVHEQYTLQGRI